MAHPVPRQVDTIQRLALGAAVLGVIGCAIGGLQSPSQFFKSYLFGYLFWINVSVGCISLLLIQHLTGGLWGLVIRRIAEAGSRTVWLAPILFLPIALGLQELFIWARPDAAADAAIQKKALYLNPPFFYGRAAFYFLSWALLAYFLSKWSGEMDAGPSRKLSRRLSALSGVGLLLMGLTITFASVDWGMSLDPHWFSTIYGVLFMVGQALGALAFAVAVLVACDGDKPFAGVIPETAFHDLGKLMFAFTMLWAYVNYSQFLVTWSGNLPEELPWYLRRLERGWQYLAAALVVLHFALPFLLLLPRSIKRNPGLLQGVATFVFLIRAVDVYWLIAPDAGGHGHAAAGLHLHWLDLAAPLAIGGIWLWFFATQLKTRPLLPVGEPEVRELLAGAGA